MSGSTSTCSGLEMRMGKLERTLFEADSRLRVLFGDLGRTLRRLRSLENTDKVDEFVMELDYSRS